jgi:hypothetical protein
MRAMMNVLPSITTVLSFLVQHHDLCVLIVSGRRRLIRDLLNFGSLSVRSCCYLKVASRVLNSDISTLLSNVTVSVV